MNYLLPKGNGFSAWLFINFTTILADKATVLDQLKSYKQIGSRLSAKKIVINHRELTPFGAATIFYFTKNLMIKRRYLFYE